MTKLKRSKITLARFWAKNLNLFMSYRLFLNLILGLGCYWFTFGVPVYADAYSVPPQNLRFQRILENKEIGLGSIRALLQDSDGFIWIGGDHGLVRFDGYELKMVGILDDDRTSIKSIFDLYEDSNKKIWVASANGLFLYDPVAEQYQRFDQQGFYGIGLENNYVIRVREAPTGELLLATSSGVYEVDLVQRTVKGYTREAGYGHHFSQDTVSALFFDRDQRFWIGSLEGFAVMDWASRKELSLEFKGPGAKALQDVDVRSYTQSPNGDIWVGTYKGLFKIEPDTLFVTRYLHDHKDPHSISSNIAWRVYDDNKGFLWIGTDQGGINILDKNTGRFHRYKNTVSDNYSISSNTVRSILEDSNGDIWVGNFPTGLNYFDRSTAQVSTIEKTSDESNSLSHKSVLSILEDEHGNWWLGTDGGGLDYLNRQTGEFLHFPHDPGNENSPSAGAILSLARDGDILWLGTWGGGLNSFNLKTRQFTRYPHGVADGEFGTSMAFIWGITLDREGSLWLSTQAGGLNYLNPKTGQAKQYLFDPENHKGIGDPTVWRTMIDSRYRLWLATNGSLDLMLSDGTFKSYKFDDKESNNIAGRSVWTLYEDSQNRIWVGTEGGLSLYREAIDDFQSYTKNDGFFDEGIRSIVEDSNGVLWLGTNNGISSFNPKTKRITNSYKNLGWQNGSFNLSAASKLSTGELIFGGVNGITYFKAENLKGNTMVPPLAFTDFKVFTESVIPDANGQTLKRSVNYADQIVLDYEQNMFSISFSALNYRNPQKNLYAYKLEGFDKNWREIGNQTSAVYTNLSPGAYTFRMRGSNNDGVWNEEGRSIKIIQLPPPWKTWWAYTSYVLAFAACLFIFYRQKTHKLQYERDMQEKINQNLVRLDKLKSNFLANTSHELLTPLNGIIGLSDALQTQIKSYDAEAGKKVGLIKNSGERLSGLVNDILDFSKLSENKLSLDFSSVNLYQTVESVLHIMRPSVNTKVLTLVNGIEDSSLNVSADKLRLQNILRKLISNAIKYSNNGDILISAEVVENKVWVSVDDDGCGIQEGDLDKIFTAFDQVDDEADRSNEGAGLGLALTKKLVELHGGEIKVESEFGVGSRFTFSLLVSEVKGGPLSNTPVEASAGCVPEDNILTAAPPKAVAHEELEKCNILVVDDDAINRIVLRELLEKEKYRVIEAESGPEALEKIGKEQAIDLIVLDVMMPVMTGFEVCRILRENYPMDALPVIFLTAKTTSDALAEGMSVGGNDFLTKPTSKQQLLPRIEALLRMASTDR